MGTDEHASSGRSHLRFLTVAQAARFLGISSGTVYTLCAARRLPHRRLGPTRRMIRFAPEDLRAYLEDARVPIGGPAGGGEGKRASGGRRPPYGPRGGSGRPDGKPLQCL
jgi:excisionase family DNA binding protein